MQAYAYHGAFLPTPALPSPHTRSVSVGPRENSQPRNSISKAKSTNTLRTMAAIGAEREHENLFHTLRDPRNNSTSDLSRSGSTSSRHPNLDSEVAALSDKLISAINHQTTLDDTLAQTRHELEAARKQIEELKAREKEQEAKLPSDVVTKEEVERMHSKLMTDLATERKQKVQAEQEKRGMETELENLTASLFDEANKMVATANRERDATEKKNAQLRDQIKDEEAVIASQTEQLAELKALMQQIQGDYRKEMIDSPRPPSDVASVHNEKEETSFTRLMEAMNLSPTSPDQRIMPSPSMNLTHLVKPVCRLDIPAYEDFKNLLQTTAIKSHNPSHAPSRAGSGSYGGLNVMGLGSLSYGGNNSSNPSLNAQNASSSKNVASPAPPGSFSPDPKGPAPLKETKFFKRLMTEDIEPTLRVDLSPTLSWLNRRSILAALSDNTLIVEPIPEASMKLYGKFTPCSLCGESRRQDENPRTHAMRVREGEGATKWSICLLCLEKVRAVGDLVGYVRMIRDGVVKTADAREEEEVWEELVRLRERLFWSRMAGGVVPAFLPSNKPSPIPPQEDSNLENSTENKTPGFETPEQSPRSSEEGETDEATKQAAAQLQAGLDEKLTTFENAAEHHKRNVSLQSARSTPPGTPHRRESGAFPKIRIPQAFWTSEVNTLH